MLTIPLPPPRPTIKETFCQTVGVLRRLPNSPPPEPRPVMNIAPTRPNVMVAQSTADAANKPKRVRTGCLTCRERHLKCDEATPSCQNCRKSNRVCKRGVRLNFIDTQVKAPARFAPKQDWSVKFLDESRAIASEYKGGLSRYGAVEPPAPPSPPPPIPMLRPVGGSRGVGGGSGIGGGLTYDYGSAPSGPPAPPAPSHQPLPSIQGMLPGTTYAEDHTMTFDSREQQPHHQHSHSHSHSHSESTFSGSNTVAAATVSSFTEQISPSEVRDYIRDPDEVLYMQVFVEEVGVWMDSMDAIKHFSELLPFHSLSASMLYNAFMACGARHLFLVNSKYTEDKALHYYDTAARYLLSAIQDENRDTVMCATTAVILNVYEVMSERANQRMNHIAGARALIRECGWNAKSTGIGAACFWLNVGMELLSCLHFNWQVAWNPDEWGVDMEFGGPETEVGKEELWTHRILYIMAKITNFRASAPKEPEPTTRDQQMHMRNRYGEWQHLKRLADSWNDNIPRTMHPLAYLHPWQTITQSAFPEVWLIKRSSIVARLFYHTAMVLLAQNNPLASPATSKEMRELQDKHSISTCGIVAHVKDRGVASVALRSLAIASECLTDRRQQEEVLGIFEKISTETGWRVSFVYPQLKRIWGWEEAAPPPAVPPSSAPSASGVPPSPVHSFQQQPLLASAAVPAPAPPPPRRSNPLLGVTDLSMSQPYQAYYVPPSTNNIAQQAPSFY
ncbi:hypothetical protein EJ06DRAFT_228908 [Trichodelitschia bisporula]|uniref:Zn(2)-C6 fungal-type domain-containing protein n=1 Tax=Trichodelitschia bisporula TaxID=703511 RepID=A0A6G1HKZ1_9PEZI|nr:hypothetical protein EJ06DRAFT_228908 [Trichodelitschia bisporula]